MISITKIFEWPMSHRLENHNSSCKNIHGHSYKMEVTVSRSYTELSTKAEGSSVEGMVIDFSELKNAVNTVIIEPLDHAFAYNKNDKVNREIAKFLKKKIDQKLAPFPYRITAENMAKDFLCELNEFFNAHGGVIKCTKIKLYETSASFAEYKIED